MATRRSDLAFDGGYLLFSEARREKDLAEHAQGLAEKKVDNNDKTPEEMYKYQRQLLAKIINGNAGACEVSHVWWALDSLRFEELGEVLPNGEKEKLLEMDFFRILDESPQFRLDAAKIVRSGASFVGAFHRNGLGAQGPFKDGGFQQYLNQKFRNDNNFAFQMLQHCPEIIAGADAQWLKTLILRDARIADLVLADESARGKLGKLNAVEMTDADMAKLVAQASRVSDDHFVRLFRFAGFLNSQFLQQVAGDNESPFGNDASDQRVQACKKVRASFYSGASNKSFANCLTTYPDAFVRLAGIGTPPRHLVELIGLSDDPVGFIKKLRSHAGACKLIVDNIDQIVLSLGKKYSKKVCNRLLDTKVLFKAEGESKEKEKATKLGEILRRNFTQQRTALSNALDRSSSTARLAAQFENDFVRGKLNLSGDECIALLNAVDSANDLFWKFDLQIALDRNLRKKYQDKIASIRKSPAAQAGVEADSSFNGKLDAPYCQALPDKNLMKQIRTAVKNNQPLPELTVHQQIVIACSELWEEVLPSKGSLEFSLSSYCDRRSKVSNLVDDTSLLIFQARINWQISQKDDGRVPRRITFEELKTHVDNVFDKWWNNWEERNVYSLSQVCSNVASIEETAIQMRIGHCQKAIAQLENLRLPKEIYTDKIGQKINKLQSALDDLRLRQNSVVATPVSAAPAPAAAASVVSAPVHAASILEQQLQELDAAYNLYHPQEDRYAEAHENEYAKKLLEVCKSFVEYKGESAGFLETLKVHLRFIFDTFLGSSARKIDALNELFLNGAFWKKIMRTPALLKDMSSVNWMFLLLKMEKCMRESHATEAAVVAQIKSIIMLDSGDVISKNDRDLISEIYVGMAPLQPKTAVMLFIEKIVEFLRRLELSATYAEFQKQFEAVPVSMLPGPNEAVGLSAEADSGAVVEGKGAVVTNSPEIQAHPSAIGEAVSPTSPLSPEQSKLAKLHLQRVQDAFTESDGRGMRLDPLYDAIDKSLDPLTAQLLGKYGEQIFKTTASKATSYFQDMIRDNSRSLLYGFGSNIGGYCSLDNTSFWKAVMRNSEWRIQMEPREWAQLFVNMESRICNTMDYGRYCSSEEESLSGVRSILDEVKTDAKFVSALAEAVKAKGAVSPGSKHPIRDYIDELVQKLMPPAPVPGPALPSAVAAEPEKPADLPRVSGVNSSTVPSSATVAGLGSVIPAPDVGAIGSTAKIITRTSVRQVAEEQGTGLLLPPAVPPNGPNSARSSPGATGAATLMTVGAASDSSGDLVHKIDETKCNAFLECVKFSNRAPIGRAPIGWKIEREGEVLASGLNYDERIHVLLSGDGGDSTAQKRRQFLAGRPAFRDVQIWCAIVGDAAKLNILGKGIAGGAKNPSATFLYNYVLNRIDKSDGEGEKEIGQIISAAKEPAKLLGALISAADEELKSDEGMKRRSNNHIASLKALLSRLLRGIKEKKDTLPPATTPGLGTPQQDMLDVAAEARSSASSTVST